MKTMYITLIMMLFSCLCFSQDITGTWSGIAKLEEGKEISFIFSIEKTEDKYATTIEIPTYRVSGLKPQATILKNGKLFIDGANLGIKYEGLFNENTQQFYGTFTEGFTKLPLVIAREQVKITSATTRPQEPIKPYPYLEEEVVFQNKEANISLSGTLTLPDTGGKFPVVVLISGSGPQDRDETFANHKPFWILADHLTRKGIAVLRFDDRGFGKSTGNFSNSTTYDFSKDVLSAVNYLKTRIDIDTKNIGLIGHSEGGIIAPLAANQTQDVSFIVLLASTGILGSELSLMQSKTMRPFPVPDEDAYEEAIREAIKIAASNNDISIIKSELSTHYNATIAPILKPLIGNDEKVAEIISGLIEMRTTLWIRYFYNYNPADEIEKLSIPVLSLNGSLDTQVAPKINQEGIRSALLRGGNKDYRIVELKGLNHLFQESKTGEMEEYSRIEQTFSPIALSEISTWVLGHLN